jgi:choice-of-anchor B domain-containing protein
MGGLRELAFFVVLGVSASISTAPAPAAAGPSENVIFHANLNERGQYNDIWGYTAPNGDEYALLGTSTGLAVINVVDPANPYETGFIPGSTSDWRDIKTYDHYAYVTNESSGGLMIVDLADPENPVQKPSYNGIIRSHNLYIDEASARCFIAGSNLGAGGVRILSLASPESPVSIGQWESEYFHDVYVQGDRLYGSAIFAEKLVILDISNLGSISTLATISNYPNAFTHNAWTTADQQLVMTTDETSSSSCRLWDISNLGAISQTDSYKPNASTIPHNAHIEGDFAYISFYTLGVKIVDLSDPFNLTEVGSYDTYASSDGGTFNGCWGVFPFFETNPDLLVASDISSGLYVLEYKGPLGTLTGDVTKAGSPSVKIGSAELEIVQSGVTATTDVNGQYSLSDTAGPVDVRVSAFGYQTKTVAATIVSRTTVTLNVALDPLPGGSLSGVVSDAATTLPLEGAIVEVLATPLTAGSSAAGDYELPTVPAGSYTIRATRFGYNPRVAYVTVTNGASVVLDIAHNRALTAEDFESSNPAWSVSGNATTGQWERADPEGTVNVNTPIQPEDDHTPAPGTDAWITGPLAGNFVGEYDVDGGATILTSPTYDLTGMESPRVSYWRWYSTGLANETTDFWVVEISGNGGKSWTTLETFDTAANAWTNVDVEIGSLITPSSEVVFRFTAQDTGAGSIVEAGVDDFTIYEIESLSGSSTSASASAPEGLSLGRNFPNPLRAGDVTSLDLTLGEKGHVEAVIFDVAGRRVARIQDGVLEAGRHRLRWGGRLKDGRFAPAGVYFLKLTTREGERSRKILVIR